MDLTKTDVYRVICNHFHSEEEQKQAIDELAKILKYPYNHRIDIAAEMGYWRAITLLIKEFKYEVYNYDYMKTPLYNAAYNGDYQTVQVLIEVGYEVNVNCGYNEETPLIAAAREGFTDIVSLLVQSADINAVNEFGETAVYQAVYTGEYDVMRVLIDANANVNILKMDGCSPLHVIYGEYFMDMIPLLITAGADVNATKGDGETPTHSYACRDHYADAINMLKAAGANINTTNFKGETPLHVAAYHGCKSVVSTLVNLGAYVSPMNNRGKTPKDLTRSNAVIRILAQAGCYQSRSQMFACRWPYVRWRLLADDNRITINLDGPAADAAYFLASEKMLDNDGNHDIFRIITSFLI